MTGLIHTKSIVDVLADYIFDPGNVGRGAREHRGLFVHNASNRTKASYTMNFPGTTMAILTHQRATRISLPESQIQRKKNRISMLFHCLEDIYIFSNFTWQTDLSSSGRV